MTNPVLFQNVNVFDGEHEKRFEKANVLVAGNTIKTVSTEKIEAGDATVIEGGGRTSSPETSMAPCSPGPWGSPRCRVRRIPSLLI